VDVKVPHVLLSCARKAAKYHQTDILTWLVFQPEALAGPARYDRGDNVLDQISHYVMRPEMSPAALALSFAGVDFSALKYRLSAARQGWISFLEAFPPRGVDEWFAFLLEDDLSAPVCAWLESRVPLADEELVHAACISERVWDRRDAVMRVIVRRFDNGELTEGVWCPFLESVAMRRQFKDVKEVEAWLATGCNVNCRDDDGRTLLMRAASWNHHEIVEGLLKGGADMNLHDSGGKTALMCAMEHSLWLTGVDSLIAAGADVNVRMDDGRTALSIALTKGSYKRVWRLLDAGADPLTAFPDLEAATIWQRLHAQDR
jgi:hypothetical protein